MNTIDQTRQREEIIAHIRALIKAASTTLDSNDALKFSQAACNSANALNVITNLDR
jgi:hypothetical protein